MAELTSNSKSSLNDFKYLLQPRSSFVIFRAPFARTGERERR